MSYVVYIFNLLVYKNKFIYFLICLLYTSRYKAVREAANYKEACYALKNCGYATDPNYPQILIILIEQNNLTQYDFDVSEQPKLESYNENTYTVKLGCLLYTSPEATLR